MRVPSPLPAAGPRDTGAPPSAMGGANRRSARAAAAASAAWERLRWVSFVAVMIPLWLTPNPGATRFSEDPTAGREGTLFIQLLWIGLLVFALFVTRERVSQLKRQVDITLLLLTGWCLLSTVFALVPDVSLRRFMLSAICVLLAILMFSNVRKIETIVRLLLAVCVAETITKYVFVFGLPFYGVHQATGVEPQLAGLWRGQFAHKNMAGPICAIELVLIFYARRLAPAYLLVPLALLEFVFLLKSGSKTPLFLILLVAVLARGFLTIRSGPLLAAIVLGCLALLNGITLATVASDEARDLAGKLIGDVTFTGRIELWRFLLHYTADYPLMGAGFQSFWQVGSLSPAVTRGNSWVVAAVYGHQGFLDTVVMIGIPGLILTLLFVVVRPALDLAAVRHRNDPILKLFVTIWLFGLFTNGTESILLNRADGTWIFLVASIVVIRRYRMNDGVPAGRMPPPSSERQT